MSFAIKLFTPSQTLFIKKECVPALLITTLVLSLLAAAYLTAGFTPLTKINTLFTPLAGLDTMQKTLLLLSASAVGGFATAFLIALKKEIPQLRKDFRSKIVNIQALESVDAVNALLARERCFPGELHAFYLHLASIRTYIDSKNKSSLQRDKARYLIFREQWHRFLQQIHGFSLLDEKDQPIRIDCTYEFALFNKEELTFSMEEQNTTSGTDFTLYVSNQSQRKEVASFSLSIVRAPFRKLKNGDKLLYYKLKANHDPLWTPAAVVHFKSIIAVMQQTQSEEIAKLKKKSGKNWFINIDCVIDEGDFTSLSLLRNLQFKLRMTTCDTEGHRERRFRWTASTNDGTGGQIAEGDKL